MTTPDPRTVLYLASASPRRAALLTQMGLRFHQFSVDLDESQRQAELPRPFVRRLAAAKAVAGGDRVVANGWPLRPVLGADTVVVVGERILGKPADLDHAHEMLTLLSGRTHEVLTAVAVQSEQQTRCRVSHTRVSFKELTDREIVAYWETGEPRDKAGAYGIQGLGGGFVSHLEGSYSGVVGLPVFELRDLLQELGIDWL